MRGAFVGVSVAAGSLTRLSLTAGGFLAARQAKVLLTGSLSSRGYEEAAPPATVLRQPARGPWRSPAGLVRRIRLAPAPGPAVETRDGMSLPGVPPPQDPGRGVPVSTSVRCPWPAA
ncbi:hypothetical protein GCM10010129_73670 [Streptomyces fumigatiscleroticus]|nr:hypothetical protein GCM10010129_73670 [Streptomyces fumigatiscleroticus]